MKSFGTTLLVLCVCLLPEAVAQKPDVRLKDQGLSGNPVIEGWYADPETIVYGREYWIYPTYSDDYPVRITFEGVKARRVPATGAPDEQE